MRAKQLDLNSLWLSLQENDACERLEDFRFDIHQVQLVALQYGDAFVNETARQDGFRRRLGVDENGIGLQPSHDTGQPRLVVGETVSHANVSEQLHLQKGKTFCQTARCRNQVLN